MNGCKKRRKNELFEAVRAKLESPTREIKEGQIELFLLGA
jgi:hypothetical protein